MLTLGKVLDRLAGLYGEPVPPPQRSLLDLVLLENVAYLADDTRRLQAFHELQARIGTRPAHILSASDRALAGVAGAGILPEHQAAKLRRIARITLDEFGGDLESVRQLPLDPARKALMRFPSIGEPGAEKILLFARSHAVLGLDSNGVRVLTRLGFVQEAKTYAATYRAIQTFGAQFVGHGVEWLIRAHQLLRQHGQELCRRGHPRCDICPLSDACAYFRAL